MRHNECEVVVISVPRPVLNDVSCGFDSGRHQNETGSGRSRAGASIEPVAIDGRSTLLKQPVWELLANGEAIPPAAALGRLSALGQQPTFALVIHERSGSFPDMHLQLRFTTRAIVGVVMQCN